MTIHVLICRPDGSQRLEQREVPDDYFLEKANPVLPEDPRQ
jgi:hypothetical protein